MTVQRQVELVNKIIGVMHASAKPDCSGMECEFDHEIYQGGWSVGSKYFYVKDAIRISEHLNDPEDRLSDFVHELHEPMLVLAQEPIFGGAWR